MNIGHLQPASIMFARTPVSFAAAAKKAAPQDALECLESYLAPRSDARRQNLLDLKQPLFEYLQVDDPAQQQGGFL